MVSYTDMKQATTESLHTEECNNMQKFMVLCKMTTTPPTYLMLLVQQKELEDVLTTDLDADEDNLKATMM